MSLFMDIHTIAGGVEPADAAQAHQADLQTQAKYGVNYARYWVDQAQGRIFCLVEPRTQRLRSPSTARPTAWSRTRSTRSWRDPDAQALASGPPTPSADRHRDAASTGRQLEPPRPTHRRCRARAGVEGQRPQVIGLGTGER